MRPPALGGPPVTGLAIGALLTNRHAVAREARKLVRATAASLSVGDRSRADDAVRRQSVDIDDERARIRKPLGDGTVEDAADCRDALLMAVKEYHRQTSLDTKHKQGAITAAQIDVFEVMLTDDDGFDWSTGTVDLAISQYREKSGKSANTVQAARRRLKAMGVIEVVNRTIQTGREKLFGVPQRIQISSLVYFTPENMIVPLKALYDRFVGQLRAARTAREARRRAKGEDVQRRRLEVRDRRQKRIPALLNPQGWVNIVAAEDRARRAVDADYAALEAESLAFATALARSTAREGRLE